MDENDIEQVIEESDFDRFDQFLSNGRDKSPEEETSGGLRVVALLVLLIALGFFAAVELLIALVIF